MPISNEQIHKCFEIGERIYKNIQEVESGVSELKNQYQMNPNSARDYIYNFKKMMNGEVFNRTMNLYAAEYYLNKIYRNYGLYQLSLATKSLEKHVIYYEGLEGTNLKKMRSILNKFFAIQNNPRELEKSIESFQQTVNQSINDSSSNRRERLKQAPVKPHKIQSTSNQFIRNPDVVAEVLSLASGKCGLCGKDGPFRRKTDGTFFLEVHHIQRLADGGDDTVENAQALCPNCHRQVHHFAEHA